MRHAARIDANQPEIVQALRHAGCSVQQLHAVGYGCPDLLVGIPGDRACPNCGFVIGRHLWGNALLEVKDGEKPPSARKLTPDQQVWHEGWRGEVRVVTNIVEALEAVGIKA